MDHITRRDQELAYISDPAVMVQQAECRKLLQKLNFMDRSDFAGITAVVKELIDAPEGAFINPPFYCDYGRNTKVGDNFYCNYDCVFLDCGPITIGNNVMFGPKVALYAVNHPIDPEIRASNWDYPEPITIGNDVWIGGSAVVCPGVTIGDDVVIGAGSVVTKDIPSGVVAAGNPCRVIRVITQEEKDYWKDQLALARSLWDEV